MEVTGVVPLARVDVKAVKVLESLARVEVAAVPLTRVEVTAVPLTKVEVTAEPLTKVEVTAVPLTRVEVTADVPLARVEVTADVPMEMVVGGITVPVAEETMPVDAVAVDSMTVNDEEATPVGAVDASTDEG